MQCCVRYSQYLVRLAVLMIIKNQFLNKTLITCLLYIHCHIEVCASENIQRYAWGVCRVILYLGILLVFGSHFQSVKFYAANIFDTDKYRTDPIYYGKNQLISWQKENRSHGAQFWPPSRRCSEPVPPYICILKYTPTHGNAIYI